MLDHPPPRPASRLARRRQQHAAAQARHRQREKDGFLQIKLTVTPAQTAKLLQLHYLDGEAELEDRGKIAEAILAVLDKIEIEQ